MASAGLRERWAADEGVKWRWLDTTAVWTLCLVCHRDVWPADARCNNRHSRPAQPVLAASAGGRTCVSTTMGAFWLTSAPQELRAEPPPPKAPKTSRKVTYKVRSEVEPVEIFECVHKARSEVESAEISECEHKVRSEVEPVEIFECELKVGSEVDPVEIVKCKRKVRFAVELVELVEYIRDEWRMANFGADSCDLCEAKFVDWQMRPVQYVRFRIDGVVVMAPLFSCAVCLASAVAPLSHVHAYDEMCW